MSTKTTRKTMTGTLTPEMARALRNDVIACTRSQKIVVTGSDATAEAGTPGASLAHLTDDLRHAHGWRVPAYPKLREILGAIGLKVVRARAVDSRSGGLHRETDAVMQPKTPQRPTPKQFAYARSLESRTGNPIPNHALYSRRALSGYIAANAAAASAS